MTLRRRITRLEARTSAAAATERDAAALVDRLDRLGARVKVAGDFADMLDASPAERYCRALLRGDATTAGTIMREALGGLS